jgi:hypothetical protein
MKVRATVKHESSRVRVTGHAIPSAHIAPRKRPPPQSGGRTQRMVDAIEENEERELQSAVTIRLDRRDVMRLTRNL